MTEGERDEQIRDHIADRSDELVERLGELKALEVEKRGEVMSSEPFHALARDISAKSRAIFEVAVDEERSGDALSETQATTIDEEAAEDGDVGRRPEEQRAARG
jgi:hypothetical protein